MTTKVRKGQWTGTLERMEFSRRFRNAFVDPAFRSEDPAIDKLEAIAWDAYEQGRKAPITRKAGRHLPPGRFPRPTASRRSPGIR